MTRLERFSSCAYAHFLTYGLRLSERERYQFEAMDLGNIAHQSMERFARKADDIQVEWTAMSEEVKERLFGECEESILEYGNTVLYSTARNEYTITRIKNLIQRSVWALTTQWQRVISVRVCMNLILEAERLTELIHVKMKMEYM